MRDSIFRTSDRAPSFRGNCFACDLVSWNSNHAMFSEVLFVPQKVTYALKTARHLQETTKQILADLPDAASEFILAIQQDTQPLTRYAFFLSLFFS